MYKVQKGSVQYMYQENKKMWGGGEGEGQYLNHKHSLCIQKKKEEKKVKKKKKLAEPGFEPTTSGFEIH